MTRRRETLSVCGVLGAALVGVCALALLTGAVRVPAGEMLHSQIIRLRFSRVVLAVVAGAGLSVAGVIFQALLRNPLAEPYVLGVSSGAALGAAVAILLGLAAASVWTVPALAFAGALATILVVYALARQAGGAVPIQTLLLSGVVLGAVLGSVLMFLVSAMPADDLHNVMWWLLGNLQVFDWPLVRIVAGVAGFGVAATMFFARDLNVLTLGEAPAAHLGVHVECTKKGFFLIASLMTGATVAACGLIGFIGLIVPHTVRLALGPDHRRLVPASALCGAMFLVVADTFARTVIAPREIPIGVVTAMIGGPFFLLLLRRRKSPYWS
jgi:iron complex transport system permease protein